MLDAHPRALLAHIFPLYAVLCDIKCEFTQTLKLDERITGLAGDEREYCGPDCEQFGIFFN